MSEYLTLNELRRRLGDVSRTTVYRWIDSGAIPKPTYIGSRPMWPANELETHIQGGAEAA